MALSICNVHTNPSDKDVTPYGSPDFPLACYEDDMQRLTVPLHWHEEFEFITAVHGTVSVLINTDCVDLREGDAVFINSGCLHGVLTVPDRPGILHSLVILPKLIGGSSDSCFRQRLIVPFTGPEAPACVLLTRGLPWQQSVTQNMLLAWNAVFNESFDYQNEARFCISRAMRILTDSLPQADVLRSADAALLKRIKLALSFIEEHYAEDIGNADLMRYCGCSEHVLLKTFHRGMDTSPAQYLLNYRLQKAKDLLLTTDESSRSIALSCGFHDFSYFTRLFRRSEGLTPIQYRSAKRARPVL